MILLAHILISVPLIIMGIVLICLVSYCIYDHIVNKNYWDGIIVIIILLGMGCLISGELILAVHLQKTDNKNLFKNCVPQYFCKR